ncbi:MAG TPA: CPBP family glutamic-type intramembrane protease [Myxococcota bacterium]|jgi:membrane protease YdiL (CAAX protease family)|nr:CPBP family glutamic-type intramembrane protease [Myxococcota bacterium]
MLRRAFQRFVVEPTVACDADQGVPGPGPRSPDFKAVVVGLSVAVLLTLMNFVTLDRDVQTTAALAMRDAVALLPAGALQDALRALEPVYRQIAWATGCVTFYFVIPALIVVGVFREPLSEYGMSPRGFLRHLPLYLLLFVPVLGAVIVVSYTPEFQGTYPFHHHPVAMFDLLVWEAFYCLQFFALEFFFRGFMVHGLKRRIGWVAVPAMVIPYCMIHFGKPMPEALGAIVAGSVLGVLSLRTRSIWGGVFIHSAVAVAMDWASLVQRHAVPW